MPIRHGLYRRPETDNLLMLVGIWNVFDAVSNGSHISAADGWRHSRSLERHFQGVLMRLAHSLDLFQSGIAELEVFFNTALEEYGSSRGLFETVGIAADSIMIYLSMLIDDVAKLIPVVFERTTPKLDDSFGVVRNRVQKGEFSGVKGLFDRLDAENSWWMLSLRRGQGLRQRLVHYTDMLQFSGIKMLGGDRYQLRCSVEDNLGPLGGPRAINFIGSLQQILRGLCEWLDDLEPVLVEHLIDARSTWSDTPVPWLPDPVCPRLLVPIALPFGTREIPDEFLYFPLCNGSAPTGHGNRI